MGMQRASILCCRLRLQKPREVPALLNANGDYTLGAFHIAPALNQLRFVDEVTKVEPLVMKVLGLLASRAGYMVLREEFLGQVWPSLAASDEIGRAHV